MVFIQYDNYSIESADPRLSYFLSDKKGGYFFQHLSEPFSFYTGKYDAFSHPDGWNLFKSVHAIRLSHAITKCTYNHYDIELETPKQKIMVELTNAGILQIHNYEPSQAITLQVDMREIYDFDSTGRFYFIYPEEDFIVIEYKKHEHDSLDSAIAKMSNGSDYRAYVVIKTNGRFQENKQWVEQHYSFDESRGQSSTGYVLEIGSIFGEYIECAFGFSKEEAKEKFHYPSQKKLQKQYITLLSNKLSIDNHIKTAYECAISSLDKLQITADHTQGIYAGLPWFFQFWTRDEAISLGGFIKLEHESLVKTILLRQISEIGEDGRNPNRFPHSMLGSADGIGWSAKRIYDLLELDSSIFSEEELDELRLKLLNSAMALESHFGKEGLQYNADLETWMDTGDPYDVRSGFRIEIQALYLIQLRTINKINLILDDNKFDFMESKEYTFRMHVLDNFFDGILLDGVYEDLQKDYTKRPNLFLAYYIYPWLLEEKEWERTFDTVLKATWQEWGGVSTIEKTHPLYKEWYTGQSNESYHRGDVWYFVNNLVAISLLRLNRKKYFSYYQKILYSSAKELLEMGAIGSLAEISSAKKQTSDGCLLQAWSVATFIELVNETYNNK